MNKLHISLPRLTVTPAPPTYTHTQIHLRVRWPRISGSLNKLHIRLPRLTLGLHTQTHTYVWDGPYIRCSLNKLHISFPRLTVTPTHTHKNTLTREMAYTLEAHRLHSKELLCLLFFEMEVPLHCSGWLFIPGSIDPLASDTRIAGTTWLWYCVA